MSCEQKSEWIERICLILVARAASCLPATLSHRLAEEWHSDLRQQLSRVARLRFVIGCCWAAGVLLIAHHDSEISSLPSMPVERYNPSHCVVAEDEFMTGRGISFVMIALLQAGLLCGLGLELVSRSRAAAAQPASAIVTMAR